MSISEKNWFFFAFLIYSVVAWFSVGHYHDDEYYQILDFAAYKLGFEMQNTVMWEYKEGVRSGLQPFIAYVVAKGLTFIDVTSPFIWAFYLRLISLIISFISVFAFFQIIKRDIKTDRTQALVLFFLLFSWILVFLNVRFSSEGWATSLFILAYALYFFQESEKTKKYFFIWMLLGLAYLSIYQIGFFILGFGMWLLLQKSEKFSNIWLIILGFIAS